MEAVIKSHEEPITSAPGQVSPGAGQQREGCRTGLALHCARPNSKGTHQLRGPGTLWRTEDAKCIGDTAHVKPASQTPVSQPPTTFPLRNKGTAAPPSRRRAASPDLKTTPSPASSLLLDKEGQGYALTLGLACPVLDQRLLCGTAYEWRAMAM